MGSNERRDRFLLSMYDTFWSNINRANDTAWKVFAAYAALFAGLTLARTIIGTLVVGVVIITFSLLAAALSFNSNLWFVRNVALISRIEEQFLDPTDYGKIVPPSWRRKEPSFASTEVWWVLAAVYILITLLTAAVLFVSISPVEQVMLGVYLTISLVATGRYERSQERKYKNFLKEIDGLQ
jgi:hypothetical protein